MAKRQLISAAILLFWAMAIGGAARSAPAAEAPTPAQALSLTPIQPLVEFTTPAKDEIPQCTIRPEKENNVTSWVVRNRQGEILRRFADSNNDNYVDQWCYFQGGVEVYRDIDSNFNNKADEYRWFNTAGTRWGVDKNEDGRIDSWRAISPHEVGEQVVIALKTRDPARFQLLLPTPDELNSLGFGKAQGDSVAAAVKAAPGAFAKLMAEQKTVSPQSRFIDFGSARPGTIPSGTAGSTKDIIACDNAAALIQTGENHDQVYLGTLVSIGGAWRLIDAPAGNQAVASGLITPSGAAQGFAGGDNPSDEMQQQMAELQRLDKEADTLPPEQLAANVDKRIAVLEKLAEISTSADRDQWHRQRIDVLSAAIQSGNYPNGIAALEDFEKRLVDANANQDLVAHAVLQRMWGQFLESQRDPAADAGKIQEKWLADLQSFVEKYSRTSDAPEALFQLGFYNENLGKTTDAAKWYRQLVTNFPNAKPAAKANGALNRFNSQGKPMRLQGTDFQGTAVDLSRSRGKVVLIHYWATMGDRWREDLRALTDLNSKRGGRDFEIIGVCLDYDPTSAKQYVTQNKIPWKQLWEKDGLDGRLANEMGVITLPLVILVDQQGNVATQNVQVTQLDGEIAKLLQPAAAPANALRTPPAPR
jgi:hypothetical protein